MNVGEKLLFRGKEYTAIKMQEGCDYEGTPETEVVLRAEDGDERYFPEWLCDEQKNKSSPFYFGNPKGVYYNE